MTALHGHRLLREQSGLHSAGTLSSYVTRAISAAVPSLDFLCSYHSLSCYAMYVWSWAAMQNSTGCALNKPRVRCILNMIEMLRFFIGCLLGSRLEKLMGFRLRWVLTEHEFLFLSPYPMPSPDVETTIRQGGNPGH